MLELYWAFADYDDVMDLTEEMLSGLLGRSSADRRASGRARRWI